MDYVFFFLLEQEREQAKNKYTELLNKKPKTNKKEYRRNRYQNISEENKK